MTVADRIIKEKEAQKEFEELQASFVRIFNTVDGKRLERWLRVALESQSYSPGLSSEEVAFKEGQRILSRELLMMAKLK